MYSGEILFLQAFARSQTGFGEETTAIVNVPTDLGKTKTWWWESDVGNLVTLSATVFDPEGELLVDRSEPDGTEALKQATADNVTDVLRGVLTSGTASGRGIGRPAAGKTGTAQDNKDGWFVGYTPTLSTAVFVGYDPPPPQGVKFLVKGRSLTGGSWPAQAWQRFMRAALEGVPVTDFFEPAPIREPASEELQRERRGFSPGAPKQVEGTGSGGPYVVEVESPVAPAPTTTTSTSSTTSTTSTSVPSPTSTTICDGIFCDPD